MKKQGATKEDIVKLIAKGENNLSVICKRLNLAPSTVSKHLHDLELNGIIKQRETSLKKWKYYDLDSKMNTEHIQKNGVTINKMLVISAIAIIALVSISFYIFGFKTGNASAGTSYIPISITDPPQVPQGTQALYINYSSISVHVNYGNSSGWLNLNSSGRLDLMGLINTSQVIGLAGIKPGSNINVIRFNITSASVTIDNITYGVHVPEKRVTAYITDNNVVNTSSDVLIDFTPTIAAIDTQNNTMFILVPSLRAAILQDHDVVTQVNHGSRVELTFPLKRPINELFPNFDLNTTANSILYLSNDSLSFNVTISNRGKDNITIIGMQVENDTGQTFDFPMREQVQTRIFLNHDMPMQYIVRYNHNITNNTSRFYEQFNSTLLINGSAMWAENVNPINITLQKPVNDIIISNFGSHNNGMQNYLFVLNKPNGINFIINSNGAVLLSSQYSSSPMQKIGYTLRPESTAKFSYTGAFDIKDSGLSANQSNFKLIVFTNKGLIQSNVTNYN